MKTLESKLTAALRETGEEVAGESVPPLCLLPARSRPGMTGGRPRRRWLTRLTPLAAAAAVAGAVAGSLAISGSFAGRLQATSPTARPRQGAPAGGPAALRTVPPYYVGLARPSDIMGGQRAEVRASATGTVLATVRPPRPFGLFTWVGAAADDRTFILAAQRYWPIAPGNRGAKAEERDNTTPTWFFRLSFAPATHAARLTKLAIPGKVDTSQLAGVALSPGGGRLALDMRRSIQVISLATGAKSTWTWPGGGGWVGNFKPDGQVLSWSADGKEIAFQQWGGESDSTAHVRVLDITEPGRSLTSAKLVTTFPNKSDVWTLGGMNTLLTPDGTTIVAPTMKEAAKRPYATQLEITEFSARSGKPVRSMDRFRFPGAGGYQEVLWSNSSGSTVIVTDPRGNKRQQVAGVLSGGRFTALPGNPQYLQIAW
ncbi:MAG TPA: hypothetical protein VGM53_32315 [Streptosporangiaceae bacterium]|jgi:hypothetical protein